MSSSEIHIQTYLSIDILILRMYVHIVYWCIPLSTMRKYSVQSLLDSIACMSIDAYIYMQI